MTLDAIASASVTSSSCGLMQQVAVSTTKMAMDAQSEAAQNLVQQMMPAPTSFGHKLDITI